MHSHESNKIKKIPSRHRINDTLRERDAGKPKRRKRLATRTARLRFQKGDSSFEDVSMSKNRHRNTGQKKYSKGALRNMCEAQSEPRPSGNVIGET